MNRTPPLSSTKRNQGEARRIVDAAYSVKCCVICGLQIPTCLTIAHLDQDSGNNIADNLALMCQTHHWMFDAGLYPVEAIRLMRARWETTKGIPSHGARMKDAGKKAALKRKRSNAARKAWVTRRKIPAS